MKSWELFSYVELDDANQALRMLLDVLNAHLEETMLLLASLTGLVGSNEVPILFRTQISANILLMLKNKGFVKYFLHDQDAFTAILPLYQALMEESLNEAHSASLEELQTTCSWIMIQLMSLNNRKYYIPGETSEKAKLRQQAMELGILIIMINVQLTSSNESLKQYINEEFFDRIEESDIDYHFMNNHKHYDKLSDIFQESDQKQKVDEVLHARATLLKESRERELKYQNERRKEQE
jgi:hypothetical protein